MKRHHFEEDGVFDWSHYGTTAAMPRCARGPFLTFPVGEKI
jgi:hypothetical protein